MGQITETLADVRINKLVSDLTRQRQVSTAHAYNVYSCLNCHSRVVNACLFNVYSRCCVCRKCLVL